MDRILIDQLIDLLEQFAASDLMDYPSDEDRTIQAALDIILEY